MTFYEKLKNLFEQSNLNQREIAKKLNTSQKTISNIINNNHDIKTELLKEICIQFNQSADWLLLDKNIPQLTKNEIKLLELFNSIKEEDQGELIGAMKMYVKENFNTQEENMNQIS